MVAIKQTVYRTGTDSVIMQTLIDAARAGKEVTVVVELMARFDEEANINWAAKLEEVGAHVVYGVVGHKTHAKMALVVRREEGRLMRYVHLGTGNYHPRTARLYTDFDLLTSKPEICADVNEVFQQLTGLGKATKLRHVWQAPFTLHARVLEAIENETRNARAGKPAAIFAKMNALLEPDVIEALYRASQAGVKVDLVVRGVCALRPGVPKLSENIRVRSIVGRFLEHTRVFRFASGGQEKVWLSSADWMDRNFFRRIELAFPVVDAKLARRVVGEGLAPVLRGQHARPGKCAPTAPTSGGSAGAARSAARRRSCWLPSRAIDLPGPAQPARARGVRARLHQRVVGVVAHEHLLRVVAQFRKAHAVVGLDHDGERVPAGGGFGKPRDDVLRAAHGRNPGPAAQVVAGHVDLVAGEPVHQLLHAHARIGGVAAVGVAVDQLLEHLEGFAGGLGIPVGDVLPAEERVRCPGLP